MISFPFFKKITFSVEGHKIDYAIIVKSQVRDDDDDDGDAALD